MCRYNTADQEINWSDIPTYINACTVLVMFARWMGELVTLTSLDFFLTHPEFEPLQEQGNWCRFLMARWLSVTQVPTNSIKVLNGLPVYMYIRTHISYYTNSSQTRRCRRDNDTGRHIAVLSLCNCHLHTGTVRMNNQMLQHTINFNYWKMTSKKTVNQSINQSINQSVIDHICYSGWPSELCSMSKAEKQ